MKKIRSLLALSAAVLVAGFSTGCYTQFAPPVAREDTAQYDEPQAQEEPDTAYDDYNGDTNVYIYGGYPVFPYTYNPWAYPYWDSPFAYDPYGYDSYWGPSYRYGPRYAYPWRSGVYVSIGFGYGWGYDPFWGPCGVWGPCWYAPDPWSPWGPTYYPGYYGPYVGTTVVAKPMKKRPFDRRHRNGSDVAVGATAVPPAAGRGGSAVTTTSVGGSPAAAQGRRVRKTTTTSRENTPAGREKKTPSVRGAPRRRTVKMHPAHGVSRKPATHSGKSIRRTRKSPPHRSYGTRTYSPPPRIQSRGSHSRSRSSGTSTRTRRSGGSSSSSGSRRRK